jgi:hypothetical protein
MVRRRSQSGAAPTTRREFHKTITLMAATPLTTGLESAPAEAAQTQPPRTSAEALIELVRIRYGKHLDDEQLQAVRRSIERQLLSAELLRKSRLKNSDEPDFVFSPDLP